MKLTLIGLVFLFTIGCGSKSSNAPPELQVNPENTKKDDPLQSAKAGTRDSRLTAIGKIVLEVKDATAATQVLKELSVDADPSIRLAATHALLCFDTTDFESLINKEMMSRGVPISWKKEEQLQVDLVLVKKLTPLLKAEIDALPPPAKPLGKKMMGSKPSLVDPLLTFIRTLDPQTYGPALPEIARLANQPLFTMHVESFAKSGAFDLIPLLVEATGSQEPGVSDSAKRIIQSAYGGAIPEQVVPKLLPLLESKNAEVQIQAALLLHSTGNVEKSLPIILNHPWTLRKESGKFKGELKEVFLPPSLTLPTASFPQGSKDKAREIATAISQNGSETAKKVAAEYLISIDGARK